MLFDFSLGGLKLKIHTQKKFLESCVLGLVI